jgi:hypothetical protein
MERELKKQMKTGLMEKLTKATANTNAETI